MATRQELYDRIRQSSKDEFILDEMIRLGFWPRQGTLPNDPADELRRQQELYRQLQDLRGELSRLHNAAYLRRQALQQRLAESKRKRAESKQRRLQERQERAALWQRFKAYQIVYLGEGVSGGLNHRESDHQALQALGLPALDAAGHLAEAMGISVSQLRFLAFSRQVSRVTHYVRFEIPKKRGGTRLISAPMPRLKLAQRWILTEILDKLELHDAAHGFRAQRSIVTNATPHVGAPLVVNVDLQDFFPTIDYRRVKGVFASLGYSEAIATILALLCTEPDVTPVELDGRTYYVAQSTRHLPQGAPTSPALTNIICRKLDRRLDGLARSLGFTYTRYADDLTFSTRDPGARSKRIAQLLGAVRLITREEGFIVHPDKTRVLGPGSQREVTGVVVNEHLNVDRKTLKRFRALLFQIERDGVQGKSWGSCPDLLASIEGYANFVHMVNPERGEPLRARTRAILAAHGRPRAERPQPSSPPSPQAPTSREDQANPQATKKDGKWWKMW